MRGSGEAWRSRLLSQAAMGAAADWLERRDQVGRELFVRGAAGGAAGKAPRTMNVTALMRLCLAAIRLPPDAGTPYQPPPPWSVQDAAARIGLMLPMMGEEAAALAAFLPETSALAPDAERWCRSAVATTFLAGLELARDGTITVQRDTAWASIELKSGPAFGRAGTA